MTPHGLILASPLRGRRERRSATTLRGHILASSSRGRRANRSVATLRGRIFASSLRGRRGGRTATTLRGRIPARFLARIAARIIALPARKWLGDGAPRRILVSSPGRCEKCSATDFNGRAGGRADDSGGNNTSKQ